MKIVTQNQNVIIVDSYQYSNYFIGLVGIIVKITPEGCNLFVAGVNGGGTYEQQIFWFPFDCFATDEEIKAMRDWAKDCQWAEDTDSDFIDQLTDLQIIKGVKQHYAGGLKQFISDCEPVSVVNEDTGLYRTATQNNLSKLPAYCYGVLLINNSLIRINSGESGYYKQSGYSSIAKVTETTSELANRLNADMGVTVQQRKAMEWGSQFGWDSALSNPDNYDDRGIPYSEKNPRPKSSSVV